MFFTVKIFKHTKQIILMKDSLIHHPALKIICPPLSFSLSPPIHTNWDTHTSFAGILKTDENSTAHLTFSQIKGLITFKSASIITTPAYRP